MEYEKMRIATFLSENWSDFQRFCDENGDDADEILKAVEDDA